MNFNQKIGHLKSCVNQMLAEHQDYASLEEPIWPDVLNVFDYVLNLAEDNFKKIRLHTGLITGEFVFGYWHQYPPLDPEQFAFDSGYKQLVADIPSNLWIGEPENPTIGFPLGVDYCGHVINRNIVRYQSCLTNLYHLKILESLENSPDKQLVMEIGGGYGGLAYHFGNILSNQITYILIDLAPLLLFSGAYLIGHHPEKKIYIYEKESFTPEFIQHTILSYDYVLLPHYALEKLAPMASLALMINMMSWQEMSADTVEAYLRFGSEKLRGYVYSNNIDRHPFNDDQAVNVTQLLSIYCDLFPPPNLYRDPFWNSDHPWYYKFYAGTPKGKDIHFAPDASIRLRAYVDDHDLSVSGIHRQVWQTVTYTT